MMYSRREALKRGLVAFVPFLRGQEGEPGQTPEQASDRPAPRLRDPSLAGQPRQAVTDYENDPFIIAVEERLRCTCGCNLDVYTCRTTDFTCQTSPAMHRQVIALVEQDKNAQEILDAFIAQHGEMVLMAPRKEGFNIVGYVLPGIAITLVGGTMLWVLTRRAQRRAVAAETAPASPVDGLSDDDAARLEAELAELG